MAQKSPTAKETITATTITSNKKMFSTPSPVHKGEIADQNDRDGDQQYDHGFKVSLLGSIEGGPQSREAEDQLAIPITGEQDDMYAGHQIGTVRGKDRLQSLI